MLSCRDPCCSTVGSEIVDIHVQKSYCQHDGLKQVGQAFKSKPKLAGGTEGHHLGQAQRILKTSSFADTT